MDVLRLYKAGTSGEVAYPKYGADCQACLLCVIDCPREAIQIGMLS